MSIAKLKRERTVQIDRINQAMAPKQSFEKDPNLWAPFLDREKGTGYAEIRFLPAPDGEDLPFVRTYDYGFQGPSGKWYIENSLYTVGKEDPVYALKQKLWNSGIEADKEFAGTLKQRKNYYANVLVIKDGHNPENNGKVFKYRFGPTILDMIKLKMNPEFEGEKAMNPFDLWEGATFIMKIRMKDGYWNYDLSQFENPSELFPGDDEAKEKVWKQCHSLKAYTAATNFKSYAELQKRLVEVLGPFVGSGIEVGDNTVPAEKPQPSAPAASLPAAHKVEERRSALQERLSQPAPKAAPAPAAASVDDQDDANFFDELARKSK